MDDSKLPLFVGGGTGLLVILAAIYALSDDPAPAESAAESAAAVVEETAEAVEDTAQAVEETAEEATTAIADATEDAVDTAEQTAEIADEAVEDTAQAMEETAEEATAAIADATEDAVDTAEQTAEIADEAVEDTAQAVEETAEEATAALPEALAATGFDLSDLTPEQELAFGGLVRSYLLENPQVIMEAVAVLEQREEAQRANADIALVADNLDALLDDGFSWVGGNPDGDVTVVEFLDYRCGFCRRAHPELEELITSDGNIRLIVKEFPILGEASLVSSRFAIATLISEGPDAYKAVHDAMITLEGNPAETTLERIADGLELDADAIFAEMESDEVNRRLSETRALAQRMQITGTPTFVFGDQLVRGYAPLDAMRQIVAEERAD